MNKQDILFENEDGVFSYRIVVMLMRKKALTIEIG